MASYDGSVHSLLLALQWRCSFTILLIY